MPVVARIAQEVLSTLNAQPNKAYDLVLRESRKPYIAPSQADPRRRKVKQ
jgi:hypothetical protein